MEPTGDLWAGVGQGVASAEGWMVVAALTLVTLVIGVLVVVAKYIYPGHKELKAEREKNERELKERELDIREREAENDAERIKANAALAENMRGLRESNDHLAQQSAALVAGIEESKARSRGMGDKVDRIDATTQHSDTLLQDIHRRFIGGEGTD